MVGEAAVGVVVVAICSCFSPQSARTVKVRPMRRPARPHRTTRPDASCHNMPPPLPPRARSGRVG
eukprot:4148092-Prorocentrum_lima.AAC.1